MRARGEANDSAEGEDSSVDVVSRRESIALLRMGVTATTNTRFASQVEQPRSLGLGFGTQLVTSPYVPSQLHMT